MILVSHSILLPVAFVHACGSDGGKCPAHVGPSAHCSSGLGRSLLQQEKIKLEPFDVATPNGEHVQADTSASKESKYGLSVNLFERLLYSPDSKVRGFGVSLLDAGIVKHRGLLKHGEVSELLQSIVDGGTDPAHLRQHLEENLLPMAERTSRELQAEVDRAMERVTNCSALMWNAENALLHQEKILERDEDNQYKCLNAENEANHKKSELCERVSRMISDLSQNTPSTLKHRTNLTAVDVLTVLSANKAHYDKAHQEFKHIHDLCEQASKEAVKKHGECDVDKEVAQKYFCYMKAGRDTACADYETCYNKAFSNYIEVKHQVETTEQVNKKHFTDMACSSWLKDSFLAQCENDIVDTTHLDISYPLEPVQDTCAPIVQHHTRVDHTNFQCASSNASHVLENLFNPAWMPAAETSTPHLAETEEVIIRFGVGQQFVERVKTSRGDEVGLAERRVLARSHWAKTLRCVGPTEDTCEECSKSDEDCWDTSSGGYWRLRTTNHTKWPRVVKTIHVQCSGEELSFKLSVFGIVYGTLRVFWDGEEVLVPRKSSKDLFLPYNADNSSKGDFNTTFEKGQASVMATIPIDRSGGHWFTLEFAPSGNGPQPKTGKFNLESAGVIVKDLRFYMLNAFAVCADTKACLSELSGTHAEKLRNSNKEQFRCLNEDWDDLQNQTSNYWKLCLLWRQCLRKSHGEDQDAAGNHENHIRLLLKAARVAVAKTPTLTTPLLSASPTQCLDPSVQDPESWDCDCFQEMYNRCKKIPEVETHTCLKAQFCAHSLVCKSWKRENYCYSSKVKSVHEKLLNLSTGLPLASNDTDASGRPRVSDSDTTGMETTGNTSLKSSFMLRQRVPSFMQEASMGLDRTLSAKHCN